MDDERPSFGLDLKDYLEGDTDLAPALLDSSPLTFHSCQM